MSRPAGQNFHSERSTQGLCETSGFSGITGSNIEALELNGCENTGCIPRRDLTCSPFDGRPPTVALTFTPWEGAAAGGDPVLPSHSLQGPSSVQFSCSVVSDSLQPHGLQHNQASLSITIFWNLLRFVSIDSAMPSNHLILYCPLLLLPSIFPGISILFSNESALRIRWPKYWSFSFNISPSNEHSGLISFRMDWFDLLAVQRTLRSLLQHYSSKASILQHSAFFIVQLSHPYMTTGKKKEKRYFQTSLIFPVLGGE